MDFDVAQAQIIARLETPSMPDWQGLRMAGTEPGMVLPPVDEVLQDTLSVIPVSLGGF